MKIKFKKYEHCFSEYLDFVRYKRKQQNKTERWNIHRGIERGQNQLRDIKKKKVSIGKQYSILKTEQNSWDR